MLSCKISSSEPSMVSRSRPSGGSGWRYLLTPSWHTRTLPSIFLRTSTNCRSYPPFRRLSSSRGTTVSSSLSTTSWCLEERQPLPQTTRFRQTPWCLRSCCSLGRTRSWSQLSPPCPRGRSCLVVRTARWRKSSSTPIFPNSRHHRPGLGGCYCVGPQDFLISVSRGGVTLGRKRRTIRLWDGAKGRQRRVYTSCFFGVWGLWHLIPGAARAGHRLHGMDGDGWCVQAMCVSESFSRLMCLYRWKLLALVALISIARPTAVFSSVNAQNVHEEGNFRMQKHSIPVSRFLCGCGCAGIRQCPLR